MWKYKGGGFVIGIPARDLSDDEAKAIGINRVKACGLYKHIKDKKEKSANVKADKGE